MLKTQRKIANENNVSLKINQNKLENMHEKEEKLEKKIIALQTEIQEMEKKLENIQKIIKYRERSNQLLIALNKHNKKYKIFFFIFKFFKKKIQMDDFSK